MVGKLKLTKAKKGDSMNGVYVLRTFVLTTYSYSGLGEGCLYIFSTEDKALQFANNKGMIVTHWPDNPNHCTIDFEEIDPDS